MRFLYIICLFSPVAWSQSLKEVYQAEELKWIYNKQVNDSLRRSLHFQNASCDRQASDMKAYAADYIRRSHEKRDQLLYSYSYYKDELNRKKEYIFNRAADSTVERIRQCSINLEKSIQQILPNPDFIPFIYEEVDTADLPKGKMSTERLQQLKTKIEQLQTIADRNKKQILQLDSLSIVYSSNLQSLKTLWKQYENDSRDFDVYALYMKNRLEQLNARPTYGTDPPKK